MKKKANVQLFLFLIALILGISSCQIDPCAKKERFVNHLTQTVDKVKKESKNWTEEEWKKKDAELEKLMDDCFEKFKDDLTREERKQVFRDATTYVYARSRDKMDRVVDLVKEIDFEQEADRVLDIADQHIKDIFNDVLADEEVNKFIDSALEEFNKLAKDLREAWEEVKEKEKQ